MNKFVMKSTAALMCAMAIGSTAAPAMAANQQNTSTSISRTGTIIEPRATTFPLTTTSTTTRINISWTRPGSAVKYIATCGSQSQTIKSTLEKPSVTFTGLCANTNYHITVTAYNSSGVVIATGTTTASTA